MKVLVVGAGEANQAALIARLVEGGCDVVTRASASESLEVTLDPLHDVILVDVVEASDGAFWLVEQARLRGCDTPLILISKDGTIEQRVRGLDLGADDYMVRPIAVSELLARMRAVLRRGRRLGLDVLQAGDLSINPRQHEAVRGGVKIDLTLKEYAVLELLVRHQGEILSRDFIAEQVWEQRQDADSNVVDVNIRRLRAKVDDPYSRKIIHTVRGRGYILR